jgi:hypothetical protein
VIYIFTSGVMFNLLAVATFWWHTYETTKRKTVLHSAETIHDIGHATWSGNKYSLRAIVDIFVNFKMLSLWCYRHILVMLVVKYRYDSVYDASLLSSHTSWMEGVLSDDSDWLLWYIWSWHCNKTIILND